MILQEWLQQKTGHRNASAVYVDNLADFSAVDPATTDYLMGKDARTYDRMHVHVCTCTCACMYMYTYM